MHLNLKEKIPKDKQIRKNLEKILKLIKLSLIVDIWHNCTWLLNYLVDDEW